MFRSFRENIPETCSRRDAETSAEIVPNTQWTRKLWALPIPTIQSSCVGSIRGLVENRLDVGHILRQVKVSVHVNFDIGQISCTDWVEDVVIDALAKDNCRVLRTLRKSGGDRR